MTDVQLDDLVRELRASEWRRACFESSKHLRGQLEPAVVRRLDAAWTHFTCGRFGFTAQLVAIGESPPPRDGPREAAWEYAGRAGSRIGWRVRPDGHWLSWENQSGSRGLPTLPVRGPSDTFPAGVFPFHDVQSDGAWVEEFSPRDCWGEHVWDRWCDVWRIICHRQ